jgi:signal transduction histidine kinase
MDIALDVGAVLYLLSPVFLILLVLVFYFYRSLKKRNREVLKEREEATRRLYEVAILKELGERVGYSLDVEEILQIITGSLHQFMEYSAVGYIVITADKIKINTHLEQSVSRSFLEEMKQKMTASLSALVERTFDKSSLDEVVSGAIVREDNLKQDIGSLFNIPLAINGKVAGVLTVAHVDKGLYKEADMTILYKITAQAGEAVSRLEEVVKKEKGKLNAMVSSMADGVLMVDPEFRVVVANPAVKNIIKFKGGGDVSVFDFIDALGGKFDIRGRMEEAVTKKTSCASERINLGDFFFEIGVCPVLHSSPKSENELLGVVVVFHDITHDIELERVREEFTSMIVHELRSPIDGIKKIMELMMSGTLASDSEKFKEYLNMAHSSSATMLDLVNDILDLSKLQAGKFEVRKEKANAKDIIDNRISFYKVSADARKLSLGESLSSDLPKESEFDPQAMKQILNNFISNSMKFTSPGGSILVSAFPLKPEDSFPALAEAEKFPVLPAVSDFKIKAPSLCVVVSDTGMGIPESNLSDLFHTYKQVKLSHEGENKGTGLGLAIAKGIAEAHGGTIGAVSKDGLGSSFFFTIPL